ncbi:hypothetical protein MELB17_08441 [Marinobacter sp. ELB17]|nr:hypothetical protein MELB17_08441 [Marinobacter sp. ELB17]
MLFEQSEFALYAIERELQQINLVEGLNVCVHPLLGSVVHRRRCEAVMLRNSALCHRLANTPVPSFHLVCRGPKALERR